jgi:hypothetical protein
MRWIKTDAGELREQAIGELREQAIGELREQAIGMSEGSKWGGFSSGVPAWDRLCPGGRFARGAVHELLGEEEAWGVAALLARAVAGGGGGVVVWSDPGGDVVGGWGGGGGVGVGGGAELVLLRAKGAMELWAVAECLRCPAVGAVVARVGGLSRVWARRLQLSAERGGGVAILLRSARTAGVYAAATRWVVSPAPGERTRQRWTLRPLHGQGRLHDVDVLLEVSREPVVPGVCGAKPVGALYPPAAVAPGAAAAKRAAGG